MKTSMRFLPVIAGAIAGAIVALVIAGGSGTTTHSTTTVMQPASAALPTSLSAGHGLTVNQIYRKTSPGVVDITVLSVQSTGNSFGLPPGLGGGGTQQTQGEGAGVVFDTSGDIVTDEHVIAGAQSVTVAFQDGRKYSAKVLGSDASTDVGVIKVNAPSSELHPIPLANSSAAQVGDPVVAIGSPFSLPETTTQGIVSAVERGITAPNGYTIPGAIQTDAAINPGNSGGPLLNAQGQVLGLNDQIQTNSGSSAGVGFAVPSNTVSQIAQAIITGHPVKHPWVGVGLPRGTNAAAKILSIESKSPAAAAGLRQGDVITSVNNAATPTTESFITTVNGFTPGQTVTLTIQRGGATKQIKLKLGIRPPTTAQAG